MCIMYKKVGSSLDRAQEVTELRSLVKQEHYGCVNNYCKTVYEDWDSL